MKESAASLQVDLDALVGREIATIAAIDAAIPHASPDYVVMFHDAKMEKQVGSSRVDLQACKLEYSIVSPK